MTSDRRHTLALKAVYFAYLGCGGLAITYWPYHLDALGLSAAAIGLVFGMKTFIGILSQPATTLLADRSGRPGAIVVVAMAASVIGAIGLWYARGALGVAAAIWLVAPLLSGVIPLTDSIVVQRHGVSRYGSVRLWGSIGFGVLVAGWGLAARELEHAQAGRWSILVYGVLAFVGCVAALPLRGGDAGRVPERAMGRIPTSGAFALFLGAHAVHWAAVMVYQVFLSLHARDQGMATSVTGLAVAVGIAGEVVALAYARRWVSDRNTRAWLVAVCCAGAARWIVTALSSSAVLLIAAQALHLLSFGIWFSVAMRLLGRFGPPDRRATLQGVFSAACFGCGGVLGAVVGGRIMDLGGGQAVFYFAAGLEVLALLGFLASDATLPELARDDPSGS